MELVLQREVLSDEATVGRLYIDSPEPLCFTLEDVVRASKIPGESAIPIGRYRLIINDSKRFGRKLPLLLDVPEFEGVRIHSGNTSADTSGCVLVGLTKGKDSIGQSRAAMEKLQPLIQEALDRGEECWIEIRNPQ